MDGNRDEIEIENEVTSEVITEQKSNQKKNKLAEAQELIDNSKELVSKADSEVEECKIGISDAALEFENRKVAFTENTFQVGEELLEKLGYEYSKPDEDEPFELTFGSEDEDGLKIEDLSTGRFTGLLLAILAAIITAATWIYIAATKLQINLSEITPQSAMDQINPILTWIGGGITSANGNMIAGALILGFSSLIVAWVVYAIRVNLKASKNLRIAQETYEKSTEYCMTKEECRREMQRVDNHLKEATSEIENFDVILNEQLATLKRIIHVEGEYDEDREYHPTSKKSLREIEKIMNSIERLLNTAITKEGRLNPKSIQALSSARAIYADYLGRIYD